MALVVVLACVMAVGVVGCRSGPPPTRVQQGDAAFSRGEYREADALYLQALAQQPKSPGALHGRARVAVVRRDPELALRLHGELARADRAYWSTTARGDYASALFSAGKARVRGGKGKGAVQALRALRKLEPEWPRLDGWLARALVLHGGELVMHGQRDAALARFREAVDVDPGATSAYVGAAEILIGSGQKREALALLEVARQVDPGDSRVRALTMEAMGLY